jgi:hypothetical protein
MLLVSYELFIGVCANLLTVFLVILIRFASKGWKLRCVRFFGVGKRRRLNVYYGCDISIGTGFVGLWESQEAVRFAELFQLHIPGLGDGDSLFKTIFVAAVRVRGVASCPSTSVSLQDSFITLGSPKFTVASGVFEKDLEPRVKVSENTIYFPGGDVRDKSQAVLVRKCRNGLAYFYAAGIDEPGTVMASRYLAEHWEELARRYPKRQSFFVLVQQQTNDDGARVVLEGCLN